MNQFQRNKMSSLILTVIIVAIVVSVNGQISRYDGNSIDTYFTADRLGTFEENQQFCQSNKALMVQSFMVVIKSAQERELVTGLIKDSTFIESDTSFAVTNLKEIIKKRRSKNTTPAPKPEGSCYQLTKSGQVSYSNCSTKREMLCIWSLGPEKLGKALPGLFGIPNNNPSNPFKVYENEKMSARWVTGVNGSSIEVLLTSTDRGTFEQNANYCQRN